MVFTKEFDDKSPDKQTGRLSGVLIFQDT